MLTHRVNTLLVRALFVPLGLLLALAGPAGASSTGPTGGFGWPLAGRPHVDRPFQPPRTAYGPGHRGVDLRGWVGAPVRSAGPGRVSYAGLLAGRGVVVVVHTGGLRTTYEPVDPAVVVGHWVGRGSLLGHLTRGHASCRAGTTCLHWGLLRGSTYLDPLSLLRPTQVRLLPLGRTGPSITIGSTATGRPHRAAGGRAGSRLAPAAAGATALAAAVLLGAGARRRQDAGGRGS